MAKKKKTEDQKPESALPKVYNYNSGGNKVGSVNYYNRTL